MKYYSFTYLKLYIVFLYLFFKQLCLLKTMDILGMKKIVIFINQN